MFDKFHRWTAPKSVTEQDILEALGKSTLFSFTVRRECKEPFRHTSIELQFDGVSRFTINRRIPDKTSLVQAIFGAPAVTYIEAMKRVESHSCGVIFQSSDEEDSKAMIGKLLQDCEPDYNLWDTNCRDHVTKVVLNAMEGSRWRTVSKPEFLQYVESVRVEDRRRVFFIALFYLLSIYLISAAIFTASVILISYLFVFNKSVRCTTVLLVKSISTLVLENKLFTEVTLALPIRKFIFSI